MEPSNNPHTNVPIVNPPSPQPRRKPGKWLFLAIVVVMIGVASALIIRSRTQQGALATPAPAVQITEQGFSPQTITVKKGETVTWTNTDANGEHGVASDPFEKNTSVPELNGQPLLSKDDTLNFTFDAKGTFTYYDPKNPTTFKGTIVVE